MKVPQLSTRHLLAILFSAIVVASMGPGAVTGLAGPSTESGPAGPDGADGTATPTGDADVSDELQAQADLKADLLGIVSDESRSDRAAALDAGERALASRQRMATDSVQRDTLVTERTNLRGASALLETIESDAGTRPGDLTAAANLATLGLKVQAAQRTDSDGPVDPAVGTLREPDTPSHAAPSAAAFALLDRYDVTPTAGQAAEIRALDDLSEPARSELTDYLDAYLAYYDATQAAYADANREQLTALASGEAGDRTDLQSTGVNVAQVRAAQAQLLTEADDLQRTLGPGNPRSIGSGASHLPVSGVQVPGVLSINVSGHDNHYTQDFALQVDVGGDDTYDNNAGGAEGNGVYLALNNSADAAALVDTSGDDTYNGRNGGGNALAAGFLADAGGDDTYNASVDAPDPKGHGTNGGGNLVSVGFLVDAGGEDVFEAGQKGTNGGGHNVASGFLVNAGNGDDTYVATSNGTNGGSRGLSRGFLIDVAGEDTYDAGDLGTNGAARDAGMAFLLDAGSGDDTYAGGSGGTNGAGGFDSAGGFLLDSGGSDTYEGGDRGANGGSFVNGVGFLLDAGSGSDSFDAGNYSTNGGGYFGESFLLNVGDGDDTYVAGDGGTNGGAWLTGTGLLLDPSGDDTYVAGTNAVNGGGSTVGEFLTENVTDDADPALGLLVDGAGTDFYNDDNVTCTDCSRFPKGTVGAQVDSDDPVVVE